MQLAISYYVEWQNDFSGANVSLAQAYALANRAVALDGNDSAAHSFLGVLHMRRRSYDLAEHCLEKAMALNPHRPVLMTILGALRGCQGRPEEGITYYIQVKLIDQFYDPTWYWPELGVLHFIAGRYPLGDYSQPRRLQGWLQGDAVCRWRSFRQPRLAQAIYKTIPIGQLLECFLFQKSYRREIWG